MNPLFPSRLYFPTLVVAAAAALPAASAAAGTDGISSGLLQDVADACPPDASFKSLQHALAANDGAKLAIDWDRTNAVDRYFNHQIENEAVTAQKNSGRCWMFSGLNVFRRAAAQRLGTTDFEFSENYLFFYDKLEKANVFLEAIIRSRALPYTDRRIEWLMRNPVQDGGNWLGFIELIKKYGVVPKDVMPETYASSHSGEVDHVLDLRLRVAAEKIRAASASDAIETLRVQALKDAYRILALNFGLPPRRFEWRYEDKDKKVTPYRTYLPTQFYHEAVGDVLDDYLALYSIPTLPFNRRYQIDLDKAVEDRPDMNFVNCPLPLLKDLAKACLLENHPVWFGCAVEEETVDDTGLMMPGIRDYQSLYGMNLRLSRRELFETYSSTPDHNMVFTGVDLSGDRPVKWRVENSWGDKVGRGGYFTMTDDWFDLYVQVIVVPKKYIPAPIVALFATPPETLPPWDPMMRALGLE